MLRLNSTSVKLINQAYESVVEGKSGCLTQNCKHVFPDFDFQSVLLDFLSIFKDITKDLGVFGQEVSKESVQLTVY